MCMQRRENQCREKFLCDDDDEDKEMRNNVCL